MKELFAELKAIADLKTEIAKTEVVVWQRLSSALHAAARQAEKPKNERPPTQVTIVQPEPLGRYLTAKQAAKYLGIGRTLLYKLRRDGILKYVMIGSASPRYDIHHLDALAISKKA